MASVTPHGKQYRYFTVDVSDDLPEADVADLEILGEEVIDFIIERTLTGKNVNNRRFGKYSKDYAEREGKDNPPDLNLSSDMLESMEVLEVKPRAKKIIIGYQKGDENLGKVEGNIRGTYGKSRPISGKARDFLGISAKDLDMIVGGFE